MSYTKKQRIFATYMLQQIGISDEDFIDKYLSHLVKLFGKMYPWTRYNERGYSWDVWLFTVSDCIANLKEEIDLKKNKFSIEKKKQKIVI